MRATLRAQTEKPAPDGLIANERAFDGLTIAVQESTAAHLYAMVAQNALGESGVEPAR
jgi:hypothetical protein